MAESAVLSDPVGGCIEHVLHLLNFLNFNVTDSSLDTFDPIFEDKHLIFHQLAHIFDHAHCLLNLLLDHKL